MPYLFLIVANSARFLAESAAFDRYSVVTIDAFADADLCSLSSVRESLRVLRTAQGLDSDAVLTACRDLKGRYTFDGVIVGAGLESHDTLIIALDEMFGCIGNQPKVFSECADRKHLHRTFETLQIPHAAISSRCIDYAADEMPVLIKRSGTSGGGHITRNSIWDGIERTREVAEVYLPGTAVSHLFLADGKRFSTVGFNTLWQSRHDPTQPFCNGGAMNLSMLSPIQQHQARSYAQRLVRHWSLRGLNCIDYMLSAGQLIALEVNPRPSATMQLYPSAGLFNAHFAACRQSLDDNFKRIDIPCAYAIVYACHRLHLPPAIFARPPNSLTEFCDVSLQGVTINAGEPVCSLRTTAFATNTSVEAVINALQDAIRQTTQAIQAIQ